MLKTVHDYATLLASLQQIAPEAHIAGGAVRDTILQKQIKDVDVFMSDEHVDEAALYLRSAWKYVKVGEWLQYEGFSDPAMTRVARFERWDEIIPVCIIGLQPSYAYPKSNIARFDFGICMAAFDGKNIIRVDAFNADVEAKTFTLYRADNQAQFNYSMSRFEKLTADRYRGWTLAVAEEFEEYVRGRAFRDHWYCDYAEEGMRRVNVLKPKERAAAHQ
jgi:hypothetical protein